MDQKRQMELNRQRALEKLASKASGALSRQIEARSVPFTGTMAASFKANPATGPQPPGKATQLENNRNHNNDNPFFQPRQPQGPSDVSKDCISQPVNNPRKLPSSFSKQPSAAFSATSYRTPTAVHFEIHSRSTFSVTDIPSLSGIFKSTPGFSYNIKEKKWIFPLREYHNLAPIIKDKLPNAAIHSIPANVLSLFLHGDPSGNDVSSKRKRKGASADEIILSPERPTCNPNFSPYFEKLENIPFDLSLLDDKLRNLLLPFQLAGLRYALEKQGRVLLADDMGLGKTVQSLAIASFYRLEWPLLIIVPASLLGSWNESIMEWMPSLTRAQINPLFAATITQRVKANLPIFHAEAIVHIMSYDFVVKYGDVVKDKKFQVIICDESHFLRNPATKRCKIILPVLKKASRVILLSGTPALSRPIELFTQLMAVRPKLFPNMVDYGVRYCAGRKTSFGWDFKGAANTKELSVVLENTVMLRRLKASVLTQLPAKRRQQVFLELDEAAKRKMKALMSQLDNAELGEEDSWQTNTLLMKCWRETGLSKLVAIQQYLTDFFARDSESDDGTTIDRSSVDKVETNVKPKYIIFAHHQQVLDGLEELLWKMKVPFMRIDGQTPVQQRQESCNLFQDVYSPIRVALLSMTAAGVGITLTAATTVLFAELFWNPGVLIQAEDRAHRIGQKDSVLVQYLLSKGTTDDTLWPLILKKLNVLESVGLQKNEFSCIEKHGNASRQQVGDQKSILDFVSPLPPLSTDENDTSDAIMEKSVPEMMPELVTLLEETPRTMTLPDEGFSDGPTEKHDDAKGTIFCLDSDPEDF